MSPIRIFSVRCSTVLNNGQCQDSALNYMFQLKTRNQLRVSGVSAKTYWSVFLAIHVPVMGVIALIAAIITVSIGVPEFSTPGQHFIILNISANMLVPDNEKVLMTK